MKRTDIFKWAAQPPKYIEPCEEMPYFWVSSVDDRGFYDGLLDIVEIFDDDWKDHRLKCRSLQDGSVTWLDEYIEEHEDGRRKLVWLQMQCPPMPDDTGVFQGCANEWYPSMEDRPCPAAVTLNGDNCVYIEACEGNMEIRL